MKVEFRSSDQRAACPECGSTPLIHTTTGHHLQADLAEATTLAFDRLERELIELWEAEKLSMSEVTEAETRRLEERLRLEYAEFETRVGALLGERAPRVRVFRRRWQTQLEQEFTRMVEDLRAKTVRA